MLQYALFPRVGEFTRTTTKQGLAMIATTTNNGKSVRLSADYHLDTEQVFYTVYCAGCTFEFNEFAPAAHVYKKLSNRIDDGDIKDVLRNLVNGARAMGYIVRKAVA